MVSRLPKTKKTAIPIFEPEWQGKKLILFCIKSIASKGRPEGFQRAIGKPFGRARRRETSAFGKAIVLSENSMTVKGGYQDGKSVSRPGDRCGHR